MDVHEKHEDHEKWRREGEWLRVGRVTMEAALKVLTLCVALDFTPHH